MRANAADDPSDRRIGATETDRVIRSLGNRGPCRALSDKAAPERRRASPAVYDHSRGPLARANRCSLWCRAGVVCGRGLTGVASDGRVPRCCGPDAACRDSPRARGRLCRQGSGDADLVVRSGSSQGWRPRRGLRRWREPRAEGSAGIADGKGSSPSGAPFRGADPAQPAQKGRRRSNGRGAGAKTGRWTDTDFSRRREGRPHRGARRPGRLCTPGTRPQPPPRPNALVRTCRARQIARRRRTRCATARTKVRQKAGKRGANREAARAKRANATANPGYG